jgi:hypothetical protein
MRDYHRLSDEIHILMQRFGTDKVFWHSDGTWVMVHDFPMPRGVNQSTSHVIILIPENYGNGQPIRDAFVDPGLLVRNPKSGRMENIPHYFAKYPYSIPLSLGDQEEWQRQKWQYICLHGGLIMPYLDNLYSFMNEPFLDWKALFASYGVTI